ncbi:unnamed protein product [Arabidopsis thaliana]|uniref:Uncharacterized protein n=4 Tax=Arabidopsis TaxID=3701 RepID=A0A654G6S7_ARATH|nr:uncharacterized protein AT5G41109 [Arabidopsis thaliana]KAG7604488.1 hypothetical protein ISN45_At05g035590 [Arabidopsis thaliana x Arabidopsis arenosa]KAG7611417.1 hypothetical protein ISN44_As05g035160 [Arabidopsis suecica]AED94641.1 hypothetical protein AT5G41109 [Arabidopsis thaliana]CAA0406699.1 unnamed protein product [Arabidopsis thaliana]VYS68901.1 unnamed protein product [Arabidopsis thaliana]|eukprot:NP_001119348.1 hypothetical protein AT5G41109 [Arabidopsis thaliana]
MLKGPYHLLNYIAACELLKTFSIDTNLRYTTPTNYLPNPFKKTDYH